MLSRKLTGRGSATLSYLRRPRCLNRSRASSGPGVGYSCRGLVLSERAAKISARFPSSLPHAVESLSMRRI